MTLDPDIRTLATAGNMAAFTTLFPDGHPQTHLIWVDADDDHVLINTEVGRAKYRNVERDPRVTVTIWPEGDPYRFAEVRGRVVGITHGEEARSHIDDCALRYVGRPYDPDAIVTERAILRIAPDRIVRRGV